jgi:hypothetical protein
VDSPTALLLLGAGAGYAAVCARWPYKSCRHCDGGKVRSPSGKSFRRCPRCKGSGERLRWGAALFGGGKGRRR